MPFTITSDRTGPVIESIEVTSDRAPRLIVRFSEVVVGNSGGIFIQNADTSEPIAPGQVDGLGTSSHEILLPANLAGGVYNLSLDTTQFTDVAGNPLDGEGDNTPDGAVQAKFFVPFLLDGTIVTATGSGDGRVRLFDSAGALRFDFFPYGEEFHGGVRVATGDVNGDGTADIVTSPGPGGGPHIRVFDGTNGAPLHSFFAYDPRFRGGVYVATADINGDNRADLITTPDAGGGPHVRVFDGSNGGEIASFFAYSPSFFGGVRVATGDVNGDGTPDIVTSPGPGGGPHIRAFDGTDRTPLHSFFAYNPGFHGGVYIAAADLNGDLIADFVTGADRGGGPHVQAFDGANGDVLQSFFAYNPGFLGGVRVASADVNGDGTPDIVTSAGPGGGPHIQATAGDTGSNILSLFAFAPDFSGGTYIAGHPRPAGHALHAASGHVLSAAPGSQVLSLENVSQVVPAAIDRLRSVGLSANEIQDLHSVEFVITDLPGNLLGRTIADRVLLDVNAANRGWFIDPTPDSDDEFMSSANMGELVAVNRVGIDLLTVLLHEFGHVLGWEDLRDRDHSHNLMSATLPEDVRRLPTNLDIVFSDEQLVDELLSLSL